MTGIRFLLGFLALPVLGLGIWALPGVARLNLPARMAVAAAAGAVFLGTEMFVFHLLRIRWSVPGLSAPLAALGIAGLIASRRAQPERAAVTRDATGALSLSAAALLLATYAAATARATSVDLLLFWGSKGARFAAAAGIDPGFLGDPRNRFMHPDYPPLVTLLYAWGALLAGRFPWGAALLTMPFFLLLTAVGFWGIARRTVEARRAAELTAVLTALLSLGCVASLTAGNAEPLLLFFETLALAAIVFGRGRGGDLDAVISVALAGAVWTKIEGGVFALLAAGCFLWLNRRERRVGARLLRISFPAATLLAAWIAWASQHDLLQGYRGATYGAFSAAQWKVVLASLAANADYGTFYLPWLLLALLLLVKRDRRSTPALLAAAGAYVLFVVFSYLHGDFDPRLWIRFSAERLLMTPQLFLFFAHAAAGSRERGEAP